MKKEKKKERKKEELDFSLGPTTKTIKTSVSTSIRRQITRYISPCDWAGIPPQTTHRQCQTGDRRPQRCTQASKYVSKGK
jgi:hypothetical protein